MRFPNPLITGTLLKRYKRFLADVKLDNGDIVTAHCANPGAMLGLREPGQRVWLSRSDNPKRKLKYSWELTQTDNVLVGINTSHPNRLVEEAILNGTITELQGYARLKREVKYGKSSRIDILLSDDKKPDCYVEVKNVHLLRQPKLYEFPDSVTARGAKHLDEMGDMVKAGCRAVMVYLVQRDDGDALSFAVDIDPNYAKALHRAADAGVEALAYVCDVKPDRIITYRSVPVILPMT